MRSKSYVGSSNPRNRDLMVGGIATARLTRAELADLMVDDCMRARRREVLVPRIVVSSNGAVIAAYHRNSRFRSFISSADIVDADGMSLVLATRLLCRYPLKERVATTDFIHEAASAAVNTGLKFFFFGAAPGVAIKAAKNLRAVHPGLQIVGIRDGYFSSKDEFNLCNDVLASGADVLWVGLGSPLQESFAIRNRERLAGLGWIRTCGGLFDHHSGSVARAPTWMQNCGLEWLHRAVREPKRLVWRYITTNPAAIYHLATKTRDLDKVHA
jgi:N-acetylglucosaminyldiphosphoundecaprenol N-acetyl-beta-D-mannosaminyltransferase